MQNKVILVHADGTYKILSHDIISNAFLSDVLNGEASDISIRSIERGRQFLESIDATLIIDATIRSKFFNVNVINDDVFGDFILVKTNHKVPVSYSGFSENEITGIIESLRLKK